MSKKPAVSKKRAVRKPRVPKVVLPKSILPATKPIRDRIKKLQACRKRCYDKNHFGDAWAFDNLIQEQTDLLKLIKGRKVQLSWSDDYGIQYADDDY